MSAYGALSINGIMYQSPTPEKRGMFQVAQTECTESAPFCSPLRNHHRTNRSVARHAQQATVELKADETHLIPRLTLLQMPAIADNGHRAAN